ncbi:MAG: hypothetical protein BWY37_00491 [Firmicutes bacterium ADurb.Bin262]|nr:MAG: hypothetical protein BWY37_00491 [Firmicutes bacterium ADurb.Bin262]
MRNDNVPHTLAFTGELQKIQIHSNCLGYGPCPEPGDEVEQHLTITADGRVFFTSYNYGDGVHYCKARTRNFSIGAKDALYILQTIGDYFKNDHEIDYVTDVGSWTMKLTNTDGVCFTVGGSLCSMEDEMDNLSQIVRYNLNMPELLVFDGDANADRIEKITVSYHRITKIKPNEIPEDATWEFITWDYSEQISIDRQSEILEYNQEIGAGCHVTHKYHIEDGVRSFLDNIDASTFLTKIAGNPDDVIHNPMESKDYIITVEYLYGEQRIISGTFDKHGLPDDFADFTESLSGFMQFYHTGEIIDPSINGKALRRNGDYIFCSVEFDESGKSYYYITDDESLNIGDFVVVPVGADEHLVGAEIVNIEYFQEDCVPFPLDKVKTILRRCTEEELNPPPENTDGQEDE